MDFTITTNFFRDGRMLYRFEYKVPCTILCFRKSFTNKRYERVSVRITLGSKIKICCATGAYWSGVSNQPIAITWAEFRESDIQLHIILKNS
jgi:hypothetical protein